jgi:hypothetical protein
VAASPTSFVAISPDRDEAGQTKSLAFWTEIHVALEVFMHHCMSFLPP